MSKKMVSLLLVLLIALGCVFRTSNIDSKVFWFDEVYTGLQISGFSREAVKAQLVTGEIVTFQDIARYQYPSISSGKTFQDTIDGLINFEPQLTPLYFLMARSWVQWLGNSIWVLRSLSVLFGLLSLPLMFWLCWLLFETWQVAWIATAMMAVSPFHLIYSQEARPYSLWVALTLLSCIALVSAVNSRRLIGWLTYSLSMALGLYTFMFTVLTMVAHAAYLLTRSRPDRKLLCFAAASFASLILFSPWIQILITHPPSNAGGQRSPPSPLIYPQSLLRNVGLLVVDFGSDDNMSFFGKAAFGLYCLAFTAAVIYILFWVAKNVDRETSSFIVCLSVVPWLCLGIHDALLGAIATTQARYLVPSYIGINIAVACFMANKLFTPQTASRRFWACWSIAVLVVATLSCYQYTAAEEWWIKDKQNIHHEVAKIINSAASPLVISDAYFINYFSLSHYLQPETRYLPLLEPKDNLTQLTPDIPNSYSDIFLYSPSGFLFESVKNKYSIQPIISDVLWKLGRV
ncbi:glycosyltransferase family 39 protein [Leptolyngbya sp. BC1307]|uniref:glycosyltransferase family 39 protein n=1 Tax=Leptolyngbya sp. BC1307 TaxID=2029589 RepID=UPI0014837635|nr:glycosyltransferase family 39 protein [Leptolyngbya sp. BC1307]